jgi:plastocyanin
MRVIRSIAVAALVAAASCGGGGDGSTSPTGGNPSGGNPAGGSTNPVSTNAVSVGDNTFTPPDIAVNVGVTVTWTFVGATPHNVTFGDGNNSGDKTTGTFSRTFSTTGTFNYSCTLHTGMTGSVKVG